MEGSGATWFTRQSSYQMPNDIFNPEFWRERIAEAKFPHQAIYKCNLSTWNRLQILHRKILNRRVQDSDSILDVGCGFGRLLDIMPKSWEGDYLGIDLSPEFIDKAKATYPKNEFRVINVFSDPLESLGKFDLAIVASFKYMTIRELGVETWEQIRDRLFTICDKLFYLEYDLRYGGEFEPNVR